jgi:hypothetical protein
VIDRQPRGERKPVRNARIREKHSRGLSPGLIAKQEGMTRGAVRQVIRRSKRAGYVRPTCALIVPRSMKA